MDFSDAEEDYIEVDTYLKAVRCLYIVDTRTFIGLACCTLVLYTRIKATKL